VREWLDGVERIIYADFHNSNFYEETVEFLTDAGGVGTSVMYHEDNPDTDYPVFRAIHPKEFYVDVDEYGRVNTVYRRFWQSVRAVVARFGLEACSEQTQRIYNQGNLSERIEVMHAVEPREDYDRSKLDGKNKPWASVYMEYTNRHLLKESGYSAFPYYALRLTTNSDEKYGRGPGNDALTDIKRLNRMAKDMLSYSHRAADPPMNVPEEMRNKLDLRPGGRNYYSRPDAIATPIQLGAEFPFALDREQHLQARVEDYFMTDFFMMLQRVGVAKMTATEVMERQAEKAAVLGTMVGRIASDFLDPVIKNMFINAARAKRIDPPPAILLDWLEANQANTSSLKIEYIGPLAQAQKKFHVTQGTIQALNLTLQYAEIKPEILDLYDWDEIIKHIAINQGMPARLLRDERVVEEIRGARAEAMEEQKRMAMEQAGAAGYKDMRQAPEPGSPVEGIGDMLRQAMSGNGARSQ
jgi:hypothetical protein